MTTEDIVKEAAKERSPVLTRLERIIYDQCLWSGDSAETAVLNDPEVASKVVEAVKDQIRVDRIQTKLEMSPVWLKKRLAVERKAHNRGDSERYA